MDAVFDVYEFGKCCYLNHIWCLLLCLFDGRSFCSQIFLDVYICKKRKAIWKNCEAIRKTRNKHIFSRNKYILEYNKHIFKNLHWLNCFWTETTIQSKCYILLPRVIILDFCRLKRFGECAKFGREKGSVRKVGDLTNCSDSVLRT